MDQPSKKLLLAQLEHFVVVSFQLNEVLPAKIKIWLDDIELPKPFIAVSLSSRKEWLIMSDCRSIAFTNKQYGFRIEDSANGSALLLQNSKPLKPLSTEDITSFDERAQAKFFDLIFSKLNQNFGPIDPNIFYNVAYQFCQPQLASFSLDQRQLWVQLKGISSLNKALAHVALYEVTDDTILFKHNIPVLFEQNHIHFYFPCREAEPLIKPRYFFLSIKKIGVIPFLLDHVKQTTIQKLPADLQQEGFNSSALTSFIQAGTGQIKKKEQSKPVQSASDLQGAIEKVDNDKIWGWAVDKKKLTTPTQVDIYIDRQKSRTVEANLASDQTPLNYKVGPYGFCYVIDPSLLKSGEHTIDIFFAGTNQSLSGSPIKLGPGQFDGEYKITHGWQLSGWIQQLTRQPTAHNLQIVVDQTVCFQQKLDKPVKYNFEYDLPRIIFDNKEHRVVVQVIDQQQRIAFTSSQTIQHTYQGYIDKIDFNQIRGWIIDHPFPELPVELEIIINQQHRLQTVAGLSRPEVQQKKKLPNDKVGFCEDLPLDWLDDGVCSVEIFIAGTTCQIVQHKTILTPKDIILRTLMSASEYLLSIDPKSQGKNTKQLSSNLDVHTDATTWVRTQILAKTIQQLRRSKSIPKTLNFSLQESVTTAQQGQSDIVDIIIPVYQGYEETIACISSVLSAKNETRCEIIVINDQSPDGRLTYKLQALAKQKGFTLLQNEQNLGFVKTVNRGMRLNPDRNVVLLNADTRVCDYWLDRLVVAADTNNNVGTVTPFSNNATICSFPEFNQDNPLPKNISIEEIDQLFAQHNKSQTVDLPTAIGFCMLIKRAVLNDLGYFDEVTWQKGYGEENDFCLRASALGWRHLLAGNVFVQHTGAVSFAANKEELLTANLSALNQRYPDYPVTVQRFIQQDPIAPMRNAVIKQLLQKNAAQYLLFVLHNFGGGVKHHCDHLVHQLQQEHCAVLELTIRKNVWKIASPLLKGSLNYRLPLDQKQLVNDLRELNVWRIHYHQTIGFPKTVWQLPQQLDVPYDFTAHDFTPMCPRINLIDETGGYCGESQFDADKCNRCIKLNGFDPGISLEAKFEDFGGSIQSWRAEYKAILARADNIFIPSKNTASLYQQHFDLPNLKVQPHPELPFTIKAKTKVSETDIKVAVIGAIGQHKGFDILLNCAKNALKEGLPLSFVVIGYTCDDKALQTLDNVVITGAYQTDKIDAVLTKHPCTLAAFLSVWPETFCYTLTEAWQNNLFPVAFDMGAIADRIKETGYGKIIPYTQSPGQINSHLLKAANLQRKSVAYPGAVYKDLLHNYYHLQKNELGQ